MSNCDTSYDKELLKIPLLKAHESYLPYIGVNYQNANVKVLHIGNCHYIEPSQDPDRRFGYDFFKDNWFIGTNCDMLPPKYDLDRQMSECWDSEWKEHNLTCENAWNNYCLNTRNVIGEMILGKRDKKNLHGKHIVYPIFRFASETLKETCGTNGELLFGQKNENPYEYIAYTDLHFMPSLVNGEAKVDSSLVYSAVENMVLSLLNKWEAEVNLLDSSEIYEMQLIIKSKEGKEINWLTKTNINDIRSGLINGEGKSKEKLNKETGKIEKKKISIVKSLITKEDNNNENMVDIIELNLINNKRIAFKSINCSGIRNKVELLKKDAKKFYKTVLSESLHVLDEIIKIIQPDIIWITSGPAKEAYKKHIEKLDVEHKNAYSKSVIYDDHPNYITRNKERANTVKNHFKDTVIEFINGTK